MDDLIRRFLQIALLRKGPQDLPAAPLLLALTAAGYLLVRLVVQAILPPFEGPWLKQLCVEMAFTFAWYAALLYLVSRPERFLQTTTAVFGFRAVLAPVLDVSLWLTRRFSPDGVWQFPISLMSLAVVIWFVAANSHIVKAALEWSMPPSVVLVIVEAVTSNILVTALFPVPLQH